MSQPVSLKEAERKVFRTSYNDGLLDILMGCFFLIFVIAPFLSVSLGDFWSSAVFLPFWALVYLVIWLLRKFVVVPRIGVVKFGPLRKTRLMKFTLIMLVINFLALVLGLVVAFSFRRSGVIYPFTLGLFLLFGFSLAAYFLDLNRLYVYALLLAISPLIGEWLWQRGLVTHHGYPTTFGVVSAIMILTGVVIFVRLLQKNPLPTEEEITGEA
jgi:hypothetical protein